MKPLGIPSGNKSTTCNEVTSTSVIWDGPNIDVQCLGVQIYKGDSINPIVYNSFKNLCNLLEKIDVKGLNTACLSEYIGDANSILDIFNVLSTKLCTEDLQLKELEFVYDSNTKADLPYCLQETTDTLTITKLPLPELYQKVALRICLYLTDLSTLTDELTLSVGHYIYDQLLLLDIAILDLCNSTTALVTPTCTNNPVQNPAVDPVKVELAYDWLQLAFCSFRNFTGTTLELASAVAKDCPNLGNLPRLSNTGTMSDLYGWTELPSNLSDSIGNLWLTVCDLRSSIRNLQVGCCVDTPCLSFDVGYSLVFDPTPVPTYVDVVFDNTTIRNLARTSTYASIGGAPPSWINLDFPTISTVSININDGTVNQTQDTGLTIVDLMQGPAYPAGNYYRYVYPAGYNPTAPVKTITISFDYNWIGASYLISNAITTGSNYTFTIPAGHTLVAGDFITITGVTPSGFNGFNLEILGVTSPTSFTILAVTPGLVYTFDISGGTVSLYEPACDVCKCCCNFNLTNGLY